MNNSRVKCIAWFFILLPIAIYFGLFFYYTVNAPINDDYSAILDFFNRYATTTSYLEKLKILFEQANEHRIVYDRIWTVLSYKLFHTINFNFLSLIGNLSLIGIGLLLFKKFQTFNQPLLLFIPVTILLFNFASWENTTFPMAALSNFTVHLFILLSLHFLTLAGSVSQRNTLLAGFFLALALFTQGGALSLIPVSVLILIYNKAYRNLGIYLVITSLLLGLYFYGYTSPQHNSITDTLISLKGRMLLFTFSFLGNALNFFLIYTNNQQESLGITAIFGFSFFVLFLYITKTRYYQRNLFIYSVMLLMVFTAFLTAITRTSFGWDFASASRYRINSIIFLIALYFWFLETYGVNKKRNLITILSMAGIYFLGINIPHYEYLGIREQQTNFGIIGYNSGKPELLNGDKSQIELYSKILQLSASLNIYHLPTNAQLVHYYPYGVKQPWQIVKNDLDLEMPFSVHEIHQLGSDYFIDGFAFIKGHSARNQKVYVGFKNQKDTLPVFFGSKQIARYDLNPYFQKYNLKNAGYMARIPTAYLQPGENKIWLKVTVDGLTKMIETDKSIIK